MDGSRELHHDTTMQGVMRSRIGYRTVPDPDSGRAQERRDGQQVELRLCIAEDSLPSIRDRGVPTVLAGEIRKGD